MPFFNRNKRDKPFQIGEGYKLTFQKRELPGSGAMQYAFETFGMPQYSPIGPTVKVTTPNDRYQPAQYVLQAISLVGMPPTGILQGQDFSQPLMDPYTAEALGLTAANPPQTPLAQYNQISTNGLALTG